MKLFKLCTTAFVASATLFFYSCNSAEKKDDGTNTADTAKKEEPAPMPEAKPIKPANIMLIWHKVSNFSKWLPGYESHDSARNANGLHNYVIGRGLDKDSNMVMVAVKMDDADKAKSLANDPTLKDRMQKSGVISAPKFAYIDVQMSDTSSNPVPLRVMRMIKVKDYDAWKKTFDSNKQLRMDAGLVDRALGYSVGDNHNVTIVYAVNDKKKAEAYFNSPELKERMKTSGVEGTPETFWYTVAKKY